jgi:D-beta-D-heptose 7-phosphate kinase/D-beta-D-heptose 1-phosphate adenosyltransferase
MVDHYVKGDADRLRPEAPIQVLDISDEFHMPGGAANVAMKVVGVELVEETGAAVAVSC